MRTLLVFATVLAGSSFASAQSESDEFQFTSTNSYNALVERVSALEQEKSKGKVRGGRRFDRGGRRGVPATVRD